MTVKEIYQGAENLINAFLREEFIAQGHTLTGAAEASLAMEYTKEGKSEVMTGTMLEYTKYVRDGVPAKSASMKQFPFLVDYFKLRGYPSTKDGGFTPGPDVVSAEALAAMTIKKWMKEGMSTEASKRFSKTGSRQHFVNEAFVSGGPKLDKYMTSSLDSMVNQEYLKEKSETI